MTAFSTWLTVERSPAPDQYVFATVQVMADVQLTPSRSGLAVRFLGLQSQFPDIRDLVDLRPDELALAERDLSAKARLAGLIPAESPRHGEGGNCSAHGPYCGLCNHCCPVCEDLAATEADLRADELKERDR